MNERILYPRILIISPNQDNASYVYEKNSAIFKKEIVSKLNRLLMKGPSFSDPKVVDFSNKFGENLTRLCLRRGTGPFRPDIVDPA